MNFDEEKVVVFEGGANDAPEQKPEEIELEMAGEPGAEDGRKEQAGERQSLMDENQEELTQEDIEKIHFFEKVQMESEPTLWATAVTKFPICCLLLAYAVFAGLVVACIAGNFYEFDKPYYRDYLIWDDPIVQNWDKRAVGLAYIESRDNKDKAERFQLADEWTATFIYENNKSDTGILGFLGKIRDFEKEIGQYGEWKDYCKAKSVDDPACAADYVQSALSGFEGLAIADSTTAEEAKSSLETALKKDTWRDQYAHLFYRKLESPVEKLTYMRSVFKIGTPLKGYKGPNDRPDEQRKQVIEFLTNFDKLLQGKNELWENDGLKVSIYAKVLDDLAFEKAMLDDTPWILACFIFAFLWFILHTNSFIVSLISLSILVVTFPATMVIYEGVFLIKYMSGMHLVSVFICIAVCSNNIYVMFDTWFQTAQLCPHIFERKLERRMAFVLRRSLSGLFWTNATTAVVILGNSWNPIMPVRSIALFSGIMVVVNFFFVVMVVPPTMVLYDKIETKCWGRQKEDLDPDSLAKDIHSLEEQYSGIDRFFGDKWNKIPAHIAGKLCLILVFLAWTYFAAYLSLDIQFKTYIEEFLPEDNPTQVTKNIYEKQFFGAEDQPRVYFVWGIEDLNMSSTEMWNSRYLGEAVIDRNFNPIEKETFSKLMDFCTDLQAKPFVVPDSVDCWIQDLYEYTQQEGISWVPSNQYAAQNYFLQWLQTTTAGKIARDVGKVGVVDGKITFMQVSAMSSIKSTDKISLKETELQKWEEFTKIWQSKLPVTAKSIVQASNDAWGWIPSQKSIQEDSINGVIIAACFCFIIILFSSQNIVITTLCLLVLFTIFVTILGLMKVFQWDLGLTEVLLMVVVLALSVNNTIHLAHDYSYAPQFNRGGKMRQAYLQKGKTITSSTFSTLLAACFLFGAQITIFQNYAIVIIVTLAISYIMSMIFFGSLCHLLGPSSGCGDICGRLPGQEHEEELEMIRIKQEMQL